MCDCCYKNFVDLFEDLFGVDFQCGICFFQYNNFVFQGNVSNNKLLILFDGVCIDYLVGGKILIVENFLFYFVKQVEVFYGLVVVFYGVDVFVGVINIIIEKVSMLIGNILVGVGSYGLFEGNFLVGVLFGVGIFLMVGVYYQESDWVLFDKYYLGFYFKLVVGGVFVGQCEDYVGDISSQSQYFCFDVGDWLIVGFYCNCFCSLISIGDNLVKVFFLFDVYWDMIIDMWFGKYCFELVFLLKGELVFD